MPTHLENFFSQIKYKHKDEIKVVMNCNKTINVRSSFKNKTKVIKKI